MESYLPHLLLISGNGRESGKTLFACSVIGNLCDKVQIIAVKISPHDHSATGHNENLFNVTEEQLTNTGKDSSRLLGAGASRSFLINANDANLAKAGEFVAGWCSSGYYVVCESGGLRKLVIPDLFVIVNRDDRKVLKPGLEDWVRKDHVSVIYDGRKFIPDPGKITIESEKWRFDHD